MKSKQEIIDKLNQLTENEPNKWLEEADYRFENKAWRRKSQAIALKILRHIHIHGISQKELAEKLNVAPQQVNRWVKGGENFTLETISKIEIALDIQLINVYDTLRKSGNSLSFKQEMVFEFDKNKFSITEYSEKITNSRYTEATNKVSENIDMWALAA